MVSSRTIVNALVGALAAVVLSFIPFSTVIGGAVAGFLEGPDGRDGAVVGALAGAITFVPIAALTTLVLGLLGFGLGIAAAPVEGFLVAAFVIGLLAMFVFLYTVVPALLGGYLGAYLAREYPDQRTSVRQSLGMREDERLERGDARYHDIRRRPDRGGRRRRGRDRARSTRGEVRRDRTDRERNPLESDRSAPSRSEETADERGE